MVEATLMDPHRKSIIHGSGQSAYRTPVALVTKLKENFPILIDLAADANSSVSPYYLGPGSQYGEDALSVDWLATVQGLKEYSNGLDCGFLNPPFSLTEIKALRESATGAIGEAEELEAKIRALRIEEWARKAFVESERGFTTVGVFPYAPQTEWFRLYVMGHTQDGNGWRGHAALDFWRLPYRVSFLRPDGSPTGNAGVNTCIVIWGPNPGWVGPWVPSGRYWSFR